MQVTPAFEGQGMNKDQRLGKSLIVMIVQLNCYSFELGYYRFIMEQLLQIYHGATHFVIASIVLTGCVLITESG